MHVLRLFSLWSQIAHGKTVKNAIGRVRDKGNQTLYSCHGRTQTRTYGEVLPSFVHHIVEHLRRMFGDNLRGRYIYDLGSGLGHIVAQLAYELDAVVSWCQSVCLRVVNARGQTCVPLHPRLYLTGVHISMLSLSAFVSLHRWSEWSAKSPCTTGPAST